MFTFYAYVIFFAVGVVILVIVWTFDHELLLVSVFVIFYPLLSFIFPKVNGFKTQTHHQIIVEYLLYSRSLTAFTITLMLAVHQF